MTDSKRELREMLANAMRNTAVMQDSPAKACPENAATTVPAAEGMNRAASRLAVGRTTAGGDGAASAGSHPRSSAKQIAIAKPLPTKFATPGTWARLPTADDVARAIIAAARETQESPIDCVGGGRYRAMHCRHYAMHALVQCFPGHPRALYARIVGCPGKPEKFFDNSKVLVLGKVKGTSNRRLAVWWSEQAFDRVIEAIERGRHG